MDNILESEVTTTPHSFKNDDEIVQSYTRLLKEIKRTEKSRILFDSDSESFRQRENRTIAGLRREFHQRLKRSRMGLILHQVRTNHLNEVQTEILMTMLIGSLGIIGFGNPRPAELLEIIQFPRMNELEFIRQLDSHSPLIKSQLLMYDDPDEDFENRCLLLDPSFTEAILDGDTKHKQGWQVESESEFFTKCNALSHSMRKQMEALEDIALHGPEFGLTRLYKAERRSKRVMNSIHETLKSNPQWKISTLLQESKLESFSRGTKKHYVQVILLLIGKELGHLSADDDVYTGIGIARALSKDLPNVKTRFRLLKPDSKLIQHDLIQPSGGQHTMLSDDPEVISTTEFELTDKAIEALCLDRSLIKKRNGSKLVRTALISFDSLVFNKETMDCLNIALASAQNESKLFRDWGLEERIPYGNGMTMLFSGGPGLGKTAAAEAIANALNKPILVVDYSKLLNCFVGQTEKNIVQYFSIAQQQDAVLFFDEADSIVSHRDNNRNNKHSSDFTNVLLTQLESYAGTLILSTNRVSNLDPALERRIAVKVEFNKPNQEQRKKIFQCLIPEKMPLADDVDLDEYSNYQLTGGEIKNIVINAARLAMVRRDSTSVTREDFQKAVKMEIKGRVITDSCEASESKKEVNQGRIM